MVAYGVIGLVFVFRLPKSPGSCKGSNSEKRVSSKNGLGVGRMCWMFRAETKKTKTYVPGGYVPVVSSAVLPLARRHSMGTLGLRWFGLVWFGFLVLV